MNDVHLPKGGLNYTHTLRVTFSYSATEIKIARVQRVAMRVPAPVTPPQAKSTSDIGWLLRTQQGSVAKFADLIW